MVARTPVLGQVIWFISVFSPFSLLAIPLVFNLPSYLSVGILFAAQLLSLYIYLALGRHTRRRVLQTVFREMALKEDKPFVLISRSYNQSTEFLTGGGPPIGFLPAQISLFEALIYDLSHSHPLVVLGDRDLNPNDPAGRALFVSAWPDDEVRSPMLVYNVKTGRMISSCDHSWEDIFVFLASSAQFVLVIPAASEGLRREITLLRKHNLGSKAVVYMWPEKGQHPYTAISAGSNEWNALRQPLAELGLNLPPHRAKGALLRLNEDLSIRSTYAPVPRKNILSAVVADDDRLDLIPLRDVAPTIRDIEIAADHDRYAPMWTAGLLSPLRAPRG